MTLFFGVAFVFSVLVIARFIYELGKPAIGPLVMIAIYGGIPLGFYLMSLA